MNQDFDRPVAAVDADDEATDNSEPEAPEYRPFRTWALQQDLISLIGSAADWRSNTPELGVAAAPEPDAESVRGQSFLREALEPDPRFDVRVKTSVALWAAALITDASNQFGPIGLTMSDDAFRVTILSVLAALIFTIAVYPRLSPRPFAVVEQGVLLFAYGLIAYQCADTGGDASPYIIWFVFTTFYAAYLLPPRRAIVNVAIAVGAGLSTVFMESSSDSQYAALVLTSFAVVCVVLAGTLLRQRYIESNVERAVKFLALADPLTGVANLRAFEQCTNELTATPDRPFALVMVDMNGLKGANAVFGHEVGDGMVVRLAKLMVQASRPDDQVARLGGDEFVVVLRAGGEQEVVAWQDRFNDLVESHNMRVRGRLPQISAASGSATFPIDGKTADDLLDVADKGMYEQKRPAVTPPYEIDTPVMASAGRLLRAARFVNVPKRIFEAADILGHAALNWVLFGTLLFLSLTLPADLITPWATVVAGLLAFGMAGLCAYSLRFGLRRKVLVFLDLATVPFVALPMLATGGNESPLQLTILMPVAFFAQYYAGRQVVARVAAMIAFYAITFWTSGDISSADETLFVVVCTAMIVIAGILQFSARSTTESLRIIRESATHDPLTRAPNLHAFREDLARAITGATPDEVHLHRPALAIADIDDFRRINTIAGHRGGDDILRQAVDRLTAEVGENGRVYRIGGDELAVLFEVDRLSDATDVADNCRRALEFRSQLLPRDDQKVTASVGFAVWHEPLTPETFVESVENALDQSKAARGRTVPAGTNVML